MHGTASGLWRWQRSSKAYRPCQSVVASVRNVLIEGHTDCSREFKPVTKNAPNLVLKGNVRLLATDAAGLGCLL